MGVHEDALVTGLQCTSPPPLEVAETGKAGEMVWQSSTFVILSEDLGSIPELTWWVLTVCNFSFKRSSVLFWPS